MILFSVFCLSARSQKKTGKIESQHKVLTYEYLKSNFPSHLILKLNKKFYLYLPKKNDFNANLVFGQDAKKPFIEHYEKHNKIMVFQNADSIQYNRISEAEADYLAPVLNNLIYTVKCLGTPMYQRQNFRSDAETWLIRNIDGSRTKAGFQDYRQVFEMLDKKWSGYNVYLKLNEFKKANGHIEFSMNLIAEKPFDKNKDFLDIRFHTDQNLNIDLVMFFWYENVEE